ncbi:hypothetical protein GGG16DRAFT_125654 [Schizophyllum commune]
MSSVSPSSSDIARVLGPRRDDGGSADVPQQSDDLPTIVLSALFPDTPARRTAINRWQKGKQKVLLLVGSPRCLLNGDYHTETLHMIHIVPRTLWRSHPKLFLLFQDAVGIWITSPDGTLRRVLNLDSSFNQDIMNSVHHNLFDGISVLNGLGQGIIFLVPENLIECLEIIRDGRGKLDFKQMFPHRTYTYLVYVFSDSKAVPLTCFGPQQRTYAHLDSLTAADVAVLQNEECDALEDPGVAAYDDDVLAAAVQVIKPAEVPKKCLSAPAKTSRKLPRTHWLPDHGPVKVVSHTKPIFWLWDTAYKLRQRFVKKKQLSHGELKLYNDIWAETGDWFEARTPEKRALVDAKMPEILFGGGTRMSSRLHGEMQTEPAPEPAPVNKPKLRNAHTAVDIPAKPVAHAPPPRTNSRYNLRSLAKAQAASESTDKRSAPSVSTESDQPKRKKKKTGNA